MFGYARPTQFVGLENYRRLLANPAFTTGLLNNAWIILIALAIQMPLAMAAAVLLSERTRGTNTFRMIFFLPYVLAEVAAGLIWRFVYDGEYGLLAKVFGWFGASAPHLLADPDWAMAAILVVIVWKYFGFHMVLYIAGLQQIDRNLYEAAHIDGATRWQVFTRVTFPLLAPTIKLSVFFGILGSLQFFDMIMSMTRGGPFDATQTMVSFLYNYGVTRMQIGFGSAVGVVVFLICVVFAMGYKRWLMKDES